jgi:outer membrane lipoprotein-sorting protein
MFLEKQNRFLLIFFSLIFFTTNSFSGDKILLKKDLVLRYINDVNNFSSDFLQSIEGNISEGSVYFKEERLRIDYKKPSKIKIIIKKNKAMYFNVSLEEVEYFNPKNSVAGIFFDIFNDNNFFINSLFTNFKNYSLLEKNIKIKDENIQLKIFFEDKPIEIRKIEILQNEEKIIFSIINPDYNPVFTKKFFSMVNPVIN